MDKANVHELLKSLTVEVNEPVRKGVIDLSSIDLCDPDNIHDYSMPDPYLPSTVEEISKMLGDPTLQALMNGSVGGIVGNTEGLTPELAAVVTETTANITNEQPDNNGLGAADNYAIIEFGDDYAMGDKVEYTLAVKPGQQINSQTIMGSVRQGGETKALRSIFNKATVMATEDGEFFRLFPSANANRHIILTDIEYGMGCDYSQDDIDQLRNQFQRQQMLFNLITQHMCYSTLPWILQKREAFEEHYVYSSAGLTVNPAHLSDGKSDSTKQPVCATGKRRYEIYVNSFEEGIE